MVLVAGSVGDPGHEALPDARGPTQEEWMCVWRPLAEVADHRHALGVGRPDGEDHAVDLGPTGRGLGPHEVCAQLLVKTAVRPLVETMQIELREDRPGTVLGRRDG